MKKLLLFPATFAFIIGCMSFNANKEIPESKSISAGIFKPIAVIELFTSQGCSSCPSADKLLAQTIKTAATDAREIFALSFHVDYWNRLGWKDPFSAPEFSARQRNYAQKLSSNSVYTPQMIVNGKMEFVGSDEAKLKNALDKSLSTAPMAAFNILSASITPGAPIKVRYTVEGDFESSVINFALVSQRETTSIKRGENEGITLTNEHVVRQFLSIPATANGEISFSNMPTPSKDNVAIVAYIQNPVNLKIIGAARADFQ